MSTEDLHNKVQNLELKVQALLQKISKITTDYENTESDYRVQITLLSNENEKLRAAQEDARNAKDEDAST